MLYGSFDVSGEDDDDISLDNSDNLDFVSRILDSLIMDLVDLYLDVGTKRHSCYRRGSNHR